jgi:enoyl-CoA hydratase
MGLANRVVEPGTSRAAAETLAEQIAQFPQHCMRNDRRSAWEQFSLPMDKALNHEFRLGMETVNKGETLEGAGRFAGGAGRHGTFGE